VRCPFLTTTLQAWLCEGQDQAQDMDVYEPYGTALSVQVPFLNLASGDARIYQLMDLRLRAEPPNNSMIINWGNLEMAE
jgi:hypothetical protein